MMNDIALIAAARKANRRVSVVSSFRSIRYGLSQLRIGYSPIRTQHMTLVCNLAPQYVLEYRYKTEAQGKLKGKSKKTWVVPDFTQTLQQVKIASNGSAIFATQKVVLLVENHHLALNEHVQILDSSVSQLTCIPPILCECET